MGEVTLIAMHQDRQLHLTVYWLRIPKAMGVVNCVVQFVLHNQWIDYVINNKKRCRYISAAEHILRVR